LKSLRLLLQSDLLHQFVLHQLRRLRLHHLSRQ
jgi:hypothetical protein